MRQGIDRTYPRRVVRGGCLGAIPLASVCSCTWSCVGKAMGGAACQGSLAPGKGVTRDVSRAVADGTNALAAAAIPIHRQRSAQHLLRVGDGCAFCAQIAGWPARSI
jgi:hypothetical protein